MPPSESKGGKSKKDPAQTGIDEIDRLADLKPCTIQDYIVGASAYIRRQSTLAAGPKKACQIRLSNALARALAAEMESHLPQLAGRLVTDEQKVAGGLRRQMLTFLRAMCWMGSVWQSNSNRSTLL